MKALPGHKGQAFLEFVLLMLVFVGISYGFMKVLNTELEKRWIKTVQMVASPDVKSPISLEMN